MKFQWSKVASVLGSYKDFIHAYNLSISSANFSNGQIEAQLDTIDRRYQQLKATMTSVATGVGNSGLSKFIKDTLVNLNALVQAFQRIPSGVYEAIATITKWGTLLIGTIGTLRLLVKGIIDMQLAYKAVTVAQAAETVATNVSTASKAKNLAMRVLGVNSTRAQAAASAAATAGLVAEGAAAQGAAVATGEMAASVTVATAGLNLLVAALAVAALGFFGYTSIIGDAVKKQDELAQKQKDHISSMEQQADALERENEFIGVLCENHGKLQQALETTKEGTEQHKRAEEDLAATDKELAEVIGEDAASNIDWSKGWQTVMQEEKEKHSQKIQSMRNEIANAKEAQMAYTQNQINWTKDRIKALENEGNSWVALKNVIESFVHMLGSALMRIADFAESARDALKDVPGLGKLVGFFGGDINTLGSGAISGARSQAAAMQGWKAPDMLVNGFNYALSMTPGIQIPWLANKYFDWKRSNELEYQKGDLEKLQKQYEQDKADFYGAKIAAMKGDGDSGTVDEAPAKGGKGSSPKGGSKGAGGKEADNSIEAVLYRFLTKEKGLSHNRAIGELANVQAVSGFNYQAGEGTDRYGLYGWDKSQQAKYQEWLKGTGYKDNAVSQINYQHTYAMRYDDEEKKKYRDFLRAGSSTPQEFAQAFSDSITKAGTIDTGIVEGFDKRFAKKNGEENLEDPMKALAERYKELKQEYDREINDLKTERAKKGQNVSAEEQRKLYEQMMGIGDGKNPFAYLDAAIKDYEKVLLEAAKYEAKRQEAIQKATETQVKAIEKMADAEVAFAEKLGIMSKQDVWKYNYQKNEKNYATKKPFLDAKLGSTVDMSKGTAEDILAEYQAIIDAQDEAEARLHAQKLMYLSRDVDATKKALDEELKLEEKYQQERYKLEQEAFQYKNRYVIGFKDAFVSEWQSGLESILNRTKSFGEAMRDMLKNLVNSMIKLFTEDWASRLNKILSNALFPQKETGFALGTRHSRGATASPAQMASQFTAGNLGSWASSNLSLMGGGKKGNNGLIDSMLPQSAVNVAKTRMNQVKQVTTQGVTSMKVAAETASAQTLATETANDVAQTNAYTTMETTKTAVTTQAEGTRVAASNAAQATVMANLQAMMVQMLAAMAIMAVFGAIFGGGGSKTETSTSSVNLGRSPDSYYMTPSAVMQSTTFQVPSFDIGGNIEQDMFAMVHKGEMVLTPEQAEVIRSSARTGGSMGNGSANANVKSSINVTTVSSRGFEQVLRDYNRDLSKNVKKGIRNGYLNAKGLV